MRAGDVNSETVWKEQGSLGLWGWVYMYGVYVCVCGGGWY